VTLRIGNRGGRPPRIARVWYHRGHAFRGTARDAVELVVRAKGVAYTDIQHVDLRRTRATITCAARRMAAKITTNSERSRLNTRLYIESAEDD
jgi:hypothetical protein